jgi:hypothetical protein
MTIKELLDLNKYLCSENHCGLYEPTQKEIEEFISTKDYNVLKSKCGCNMIISKRDVLELLVDNFEEHLSRNHFVKDKFDETYRLNVGLLERNLKWYNQLLYYVKTKLKI